MVIDLNTYKNNKEAARELVKITNYFTEVYPNKTWGWIGLTALLFAQMAIEKYLEDNDPDAGFYQALKSMLWGFQNKVNEMQKNKGGKQA